MNAAVKLFEENGAAIRQVLIDEPRTSECTRGQLTAYVAERIGIPASTLATVWRRGEGKYWRSERVSVKTRTGLVTKTNTYPIMDASVDKAPVTEVTVEEVGVEVRLMEALKQSEVDHANLTSLVTGTINKITAQFHETVEQRDRDLALAKHDLSVKESELEELREKYAQLVKLNDERVARIHGLLHEETEKRKAVQADLAAAKAVLANTPQYEFVELKLRRLSDRVQTLSGDHATLETDTFDSSALGIKPGCVLKIVKP